MKRWELNLLCTIVLGLALAGLATAESPAAPIPQTQTLEQLRLAIFQAPPSDSGDADRIGTLSPDVQPASHCTGDFCTQLLCECAHECHPCGIARFNCPALLCVCKSC